MDFSPCIIIPSYAANETRVNNALKLFNTLNYIFHEVPVYVLAQAWSNEDVAKCPQNIHMICRPKLGITPARQALRKWVLNNTKHTYFILMDDDCEPICGIGADLKECADRYLKCLRAHPEGYALSRYPFYLNFAAVSRTIFEQMDFPNLSVEPIDGYEIGSEDLAFTASCSMRFPESRFYISTGVADGRSDMSNALNSTWSNLNTKPDNVFILLDSTLLWLQKQPYFIPLPDNELCYSDLKENTFLLWSTLAKDGTVTALFKSDLNN